MKTCERCGKEHDGSFGSGRFCSRACANGRLTDHAATKDAACVSCGKQIQIVVNASRKVCLCPDCKVARKKERNTYPGHLSVKIARDQKNVRLGRGNKDAKSILDLSKRTVSKIVKRMRLPCSECGYQNDHISLDFHHIHQKKDHGSDLMCNLSYLCPNCHRLAHNGVITKFITAEEQIGDTWKEYYYVKMGR